MMRSLYSGVSGLRTHQVRMDVIGTNLANVNTVGFKASRVTFRDVLYQTVSNPAMPSDVPQRGGTNPSQIGLGVMIGSIDVLNTRAGPMLTDKPTDLYIDGEGYFAVLNASSGVTYYSRVGDFNFIPVTADDGEQTVALLDGNGNFVLGVVWDPPLDEYDPSHLGDDGSYADELNVITIAEFTKYSQIRIGEDGVITGYDTSAEAGEYPTKYLGQIILNKFMNNDGLFQEGNTYLLPSVSSGNPVAYAAGFGGTGETITSRLEMSNVELSKEFTDMIVTQRGFQANSRIITVSDEMLQELVNLKR